MYRPKPLNKKASYSSTIESLEATLAMYLVSFIYTRKPGQRPSRYPAGQEIVRVSQEEIEAMRKADGVPKEAGEERLASYVAMDKRQSRAFGRCMEITVERANRPSG